MTIAFTYFSSDKCSSPNRRVLASEESIFKLTYSNWSNFILSVIIRITQGDVTKNLIELKNVHLYTTDTPITVSSNLPYDNDEKQRTAISIDLEEGLVSQGFMNKNNYKLANKDSLDYGTFSIDNTTTFYFEAGYSFLDIVIEYEAYYDAHFS